MRAGPPPDGAWSTAFFSRRTWRRRTTVTMTMMTSTESAMARPTAKTTVTDVYSPDDVDDGSLDNDGSSPVSLSFPVPTTTHRHTARHQTRSVVIIIPAKAREYVFTGVGLSVCLSVITITKKIVDGFVPNFMGRFLGGKGRPSSCFVTIGRGMRK